MFNPLSSYGSHPSSGSREGYVRGLSSAADRDIKIGRTAILIIWIKYIRNCQGSLFLDEPVIRHEEEC